MKSITTALVSVILATACTAVTADAKAAPAEREITIEKPYLNFPVKNGAEGRLISFLIDGELVREFEISLAPADPDFWVFLDVREFKGKTAILRINEENEGFDAVYQDDTFPGEDELYKERLRPQFHFSSRRGWNNDPNGLVYYDGEYHLFYQHNPFGWAWGNMTWGHAVSTDLVHWTELGDAIHPDGLGTIFSGSAVVDERNTTGFQTGDEKPLVCIYTSAGGTNPWSEREGSPFTQSIAYSNDRGRTFTVYEGNPVQGHINGGNRDPKVIWHEPTNQWVIVLYLDEGRMGFFTSKDLKSWQFHSEIKPFHECPELFQLPVDGDETNKKWILYGAAGDYYIGEFDGKEYKPDTEPIRFHYGNCFYASQTFNNIPEEDGRRIQMAWGQVPAPGMPFNQMMLFPVELTLHTTDDGLRMFAYPVREIEKLHGRTYTYREDVIEEGRRRLPVGRGRGDDDGDSGLYDISAEFEVGDACRFGLIIKNMPVTYLAGEQVLLCEDLEAPLEPIDGKIRLRILVDRTSLEIFANDGRVYMPVARTPIYGRRGVEVFSRGGDTKVNELKVVQLRSIWD